MILDFRKNAAPHVPITPCDSSVGLIVASAEEVQTAKVIDGELQHCHQVHSHLFHYSLSVLLYFLFCLFIFPVYISSPF